MDSSLIMQVVIGCYTQKFEPVPLQSTDDLCQALVHYFNLPEELWPPGCRMAYLPTCLDAEVQQEFKEQLRAALPYAEAIARDIAKVYLESERPVGMRCEAVLPLDAAATWIAARGFATYTHGNESKSMRT